ncbi:MAG TPA: hypothetical protein VFW71_05040 [Actinomycetota bacterium]|nr:hypothetical protein [Actinomycetota bacterium]
MDTQKRFIALAGGAVVLAGLVVVLVLALTHHKSAAAKTRTTPTPSASHAPSPSPTPSPPAPTTAPPPIAAPPPTAPAPTAPAAGSGNQLVPSSYGFSYPASWSLSRLVVRTAAATTATATAPSGPGRLDYLSDTSPTAYYPDHTVDRVGIEAAIISLFPCSKFQSLSVVPNKGFVYTCAPGTTGGVAVHVSGTVLVAPYPRGFRVLQVVVPATQDAQAAAILASFH